MTKFSQCIVLFLWENGYIFQKVSICTNDGDNIQKNLAIKEFCIRQGGMWRMNFRVRVFSPGDYLNTGGGE